jgi:sporulation protein YlmC with PRC-barrel domain
MLRSVKELSGLNILANDGEIGNVYEFYFDDQNWTIRYLVVKTGNWLSNKQVLISPAAIGKPEWDKNRLPVNLTKKQIEDSPDISTDKPVSRQNEIDLVNYYNWPMYWDFDMGMAVTPGTAYLTQKPLIEQMNNTDTSSDKEKEQEEKKQEEKKDDPHLRSSREVNTYRIQSTDREIGHLKDFIVDDNTWIIRYIVVDTGGWISSGRKVLVSPHWIEKINWNESKVHIALSSDSIKNSPEYNPSETLGREYEEILYEHYGLPKYWL